MQPSKLPLLDKQVPSQPDHALDVLPFGVCFCDRDGAIVRCNRAVAEICGRAPLPGEPADRFWATLTGREDQPVRGVLAGGNAVRDLDITIVRGDGARMTVCVSIDAVAEGAVISFRDAPVPRRLPWAQPDDEQHARALLGALPVAVYTTDAAGRITFYNQAAAALWGREPALGVETWCGSRMLRWPDGKPMRHDESPMAVALRERHAICGAEATAERPDGSQYRFLCYPTPVWDDRGDLTGAVATLVDITDRRSSEELSQRLASIVESSNDAIVGKNLDGIITSWNQGAERLFGYTAAEAIGNPVTMLIPPERKDEEPEILRRIRRGEQIDHYDTVRLRKDGSQVDISLAVSPMKNAGGVIIGASKIARDNTERRRAHEKQMLLLREMSHRVKNLFALTGGVVALSARFARTPEELAETVRGRLNALAQAHDLTLPDLRDGSDRPDRQTTLRALVQTIVSPHSDPARDGGDRVTIGDGPEVPIGGGAITSIALLLHEFATNAAKYGALSLPTGRVHVAWTVEGDDLHLVWRERGGPPVGGQPDGEGFGSLLGRATVKGQLGGSISREWEPEGLTVHLSVTLSRLAK